MRFLTDELEVRSDPTHGTTVRMAKQLSMERDGSPSFRRDGGPVRAAYDSNPPKPPR